MKNNKIRTKSGVITFIGYLLSPLSWWNDLFINIPLAYLFGSFFGFFSKNLFLPMMIFGYWITNILGLLMLHYGAKGLINGKYESIFSRSMYKDILFAFIYTAIVYLCIHFGWIKFPTEYLSKLF